MILQWPRASETGLIVYSICAAYREQAENPTHTHALGVYGWGTPGIFITPIFTQTWASSSMNCTVEWDIWCISFVQVCFEVSWMIHFYYRLWGRNIWLFLWCVVCLCHNSSWSCLLSLDHSTLYLGCPRVWHRWTYFSTGIKFAYNNYAHYVSSNWSKILILWMCQNQFLFLNVTFLSLITDW